MNKSNAAKRDNNNQQLEKRVDVLFDLITKIYGPEKLSLKAEKLKAKDLINSDNIVKRTYALQKIVFGEHASNSFPDKDQIPKMLEKIEDQLADILAKKAVEKRLQKKVEMKMREQHKRYMKEIKQQVLKEESGFETPATLKKYAKLEKLETQGLNRSLFELLRPKTLDKVVGQEEPINALVSKIASPFPQHVLIYGPPGVGKTTAARLVLETAKKMKFSPFNKEARFVEVDGSTLRWDPREITNPLLGSVHDPIYQGAKRSLASTGVPEPKTGLVTEAHGGILFIDEIGEMDLILQNKLLKVLEDKRVSFDSSYYDSSEPNIPKYIKKLFEEGAPADFILIGATTKHPSQINPALRSRCAEIFFNPLKPDDIKKIVQEAFSKLNVEWEAGADELISDYTIEGRKAVNIVADAYSTALNNASENKQKRLKITKNHIYQVLRVSRISPNSVKKAYSKKEIGRIYGLGVRGFLGSLIEFESIVFPVKHRKGRIRFNETAGSMTKDSVFNAATVIRKLYGIDLLDYDVHVNVVGGGKIDGPSAGTAIMLSILSSLKQKPISQDIAVTGELSLQGRVKPVGGVYEKIFGAKHGGIRKVIIPEENIKDVPHGIKGVEICPVTCITDVIREVFEDNSLIAGVGR